MTMPSQTNETTEALRTLHRIHKQLGDLKERLERGPRLAKARRANLKKLQDQLQLIEAEAHALKTMVNDKNMQLSTDEAALERRRQQLRQASDNKEYQALKDEIAAHEMANSVLTDEILEAMERQDELKRRIDEASHSAGKSQEELQKTEEEVERQTPVIQGDLERLQSELKQSEAALPGEFREIYRRVVRAKGEDALAPVDGEFCGGCNQHIPVNDINAMMLGEAKVCRSCGRLLYLPEGYST
jgi:predicted  nucleic acid-binding Zn-ribbon protein